MIEAESIGRSGAMARNSKIEWTDHTFNPWWGCVKVSPACKHCYAEAWAKRVGAAVWGANAPRRFFGEAHWKEPERWNREAERRGVRERVFCASMADVFEDRRDLDVWRDKLATLIARTPSLDWLLLTKRPDKAVALAPWKGEWPQNVWLGTTAETQAWAQRRLPELLRTPAQVRFLSCEPLFAALDLGEWLGSGVDWLITGGESGPRARPSNPAWFRALRDQCLANDVAFYFKQWGEWAPSDQFGSANGDGSFVKAGKRNTGRKLDGQIWSEVPLAPAALRATSLGEDVSGDVVGNRLRSRAAA